MSSDQLATIPMVESPAAWVKDSEAKQCHCCKTEFSLFTRKHHCRGCGLIFCDSCTSDRVRVRNQNGLQRVCFSCYSRVAELTPAERKTVLETCALLDEELLMDTLVLKRDRDRTKGILLITNQSIIGLERGGGTKNIFKKSHLIDLVTLNFDKTPFIIHLVFGKLSHQPSNVVFETPIAEQVVKCIREAYRDLTIGLPVEYSIQVNAPQEQLLALNRRAGALPMAQGFCQMYRALAAFHNETPAPQVMWFVEDLVSQNCLEFDLEKCPGVDESSKLHFHPVPIFGALQHNVYFRSLVVSRSNRKDIVNLAAQVVKYNRNLTRIRLVKLKESGALYKLFVALQENKESLITEIDLSGTAMNDKAAVGLVQMVGGLERGLKQLKLTKCDLSARHVGSLIRDGLEKNWGLTLQLEELDLSGNKMDEDSSTALQSLFLKLGDHCKLTHIRLANCNLTPSYFLRPLHLLPLVQEIDLSYNKLDPAACQLLCTALERGQHFTSVLLAGCGISAESAGAICAAISRNQCLHNVTLMLAKNHFGDKGAIAIAKAFSVQCNLYILDLSETKCSEAGIIQFCESMEKLSEVCELDTLVLNDNSFNLKRTHALKAAHALGSFISIVGLKVLSFCGGCSNTFLSALLGVLGGNTTLLELRISRNTKLCDDGAIAISKLLRANNFLVSLYCDQCSITLSGYQAIYLSMLHNTSLQFFEFPWKDFSKNFYALQNQGKSSLLKDSVMMIQTRLVQNRQAGVHARFLEKPTARPILTAMVGHAQVPQSLLDSASDGAANTLEIPPPAPIPAAAAVASGVAVASALHEEESHLDAPLAIVAPPPVHISAPKRSASASNFAQSSAPPPAAVVAAPVVAPVPPPAPAPAAAPAPPPAPPPAPVAPPVAPPAPMGGGGPPPPPPPGPPPPSAAKMPPKTKGRADMLSSIAGFNAKKLKKATTVDKSKPLLSSSGGSSTPAGGGSTAGGPAPGPGNSLAAAIAARRAAMEG